MKRLNLIIILISLKGLIKIKKLKWSGWRSLPTGAAIGDNMLDKFLGSIGHGLFVLLSQGDRAGRSGNEWTQG